MNRRTFLGASLSAIPFVMGAQEIIELKDKVSGEQLDTLYPKFGIQDVSFKGMDLEYEGKVIRVIERTVVAKLDSPAPRGISGAKYSHSREDNYGYALWYPIVLWNKDGGIVPDPLVMNDKEYSQLTPITKWKFSEDGLEVRVTTYDKTDGIYQFQVGPFQIKAG